MTGLPEVLSICGATDPGSRQDPHAASAAGNSLLPLTNYWSFCYQGRKKELLYCKILLKEGNVIFRKSQMTFCLVIFCTKPNGEVMETEGETLLLIASFILLL